MQRALGFYVGVLGFSNADWGSDDFTSVSSGKCGIYLCRGDQGRGGAWVWVGVDDVRELHRHLRQHGVKIRMEPTNFSWALEIHVEDPDGNILRFGSGPE
jgi:predicted enzyme related to lactoylglutathione lyase